ncbi:MAG TPA: acyl-CoA dehydrogenase family protein [Caulobacterales bacterium]|nr:acyl-CoA dehydrogenase family protein [Caulobacterales bacterium]
MDLDDTPEEAAFRAEVRAWLESRAARRIGPSRWPDKARELEALTAARAWQRAKADAGYAAITWPKQFGGMGGTPIQAVIFEQEEAEFDTPPGFFAIGLQICLPALFTHGTDAHRTRHLPPALQGEEIWCQLFSEPGAGSDLAGIRTRAVKDGDRWIINGQKIWTSGAHYCDFGLLLTRTDPTLPKHKGLTMFFIDMKSPGVDVRPLRQATGAAEFNEVFFTDVVVPDSQRLGAVNEGWRVALTALMHERVMVMRTLPLPTYVDALRVARAAHIDGKPALEDARVRERIANWYLRDQGLKLNRFRGVTALSQGQPPGPEQSIGKVIAARQGQEIATFLIDLLGEDGLLVGAEGANAALQRQWMWGAAMRVAGGSDEILKNIVAERVLGLGDEIRIDKDVPFSSLR